MHIIKLLKANELSIKITLTITNEFILTITQSSNNESRLVIYIID